MLSVKSVAETTKVINDHFGTLRTGTEVISADVSYARILANDMISSEYVPNFNRSTVDGFAVISRDIQGSSETTPMVLKKVGEASMGKAISTHLKPGECVYVPTGGAIPAGADTMVMLEYTENLTGDEFAFYKPSPPGANMIFRGEDLRPGSVILRAGHALNSADLGTLAAMGVSRLAVSLPPKIAIISTGDELVPPESPVAEGQIRDVNGKMLLSLVRENGGAASFKGIIPDEEDELEVALLETLADSDLILVSGGTSVGVKDALPNIISRLGQIYVHGVAVKPGKPTIVGEIQGKPVFGLPGNPVAAFFMFSQFVRPLLLQMMGAQTRSLMIPATLQRAISSNQGREEFILVNYESGKAEPVLSKSGLISTVSKSNGYFIVPRDTEGLAKDASVMVTIF